MSWQPVDCHAHSTHSDGTLTVAEIVDLARERGVRPSVADHITSDIAKGIRTVDGVVPYLEDLEGHDVLRGGEFCWHDTLWRELPPAIVTRFSHRLGSLHAVAVDSGALVHAFRRFPPALTPDAYMQSHIRAFEALASEMPVDILAHPTLLPIPLRKLPLEELWTEEREDRAVDALFHAGIAFEISNRYRPHERFVRRAVDRGVRIALGSDGHTVTQVADVAWPLALARSLGVSDAALYDPAVHGSRTGGAHAR
ncbi:MAG: hypothetical protein H0X64_03320 [Gemmatimonadaceae bacterium]|nr:hypothetical protein [Gemmatimonadaceae bacterium]